MLLFRFFAVLSLMLGVAACGPSVPKTPFKGTDITGVPWGKELRLTDHNGKPRALADFNGKAVAIFFGYTHCPDVCPTTLGELALTLKQLGSDADKVQVLFVTLDPGRDTPEVLRQYVPSFHPGFLGLTGSEAEVAQAAKSFNVFYEKKESGSKAGYLVDHSANTFLIDPQGRVRLLYGFGAAPASIVHDIKQLLDGK